MTTTPVPTCTDDLLAEIDVPRYDCTSGGVTFCKGCYRMEECEYGDYISVVDYAALLARLHAAEEELRITNALLEQRERVLNAIPECPMHGPDCVPHAVEWVHAAEKDAGRYRWLTRQAWFQSAFDRYDIDDGGLQSIFERECAHIIDKSIQSEASK